MQLGQARYWAACVEASSPHSEWGSDLADAQRKRRRHLALWTSMLLLLYAACIGGGVFTLLYIGSFIHLEWAEFATASARALVYFTVCALIMAAANHWIYLHRKFGAKLSHSSVLWLRRFHKSDGEHRFFRRVLALATPLTFAVTLRDSKVMGNLEQGVRRATPALILVISLTLGGALFWEALNAACLAADHRCRALDHIWVFDSAEPREDTEFYDEVRPFTLAFAFTLALLSVFALISGFVHVVAPRLGFIRPTDADATRVWFDALHLEGSSNTTYVVRTADEHWQGVVEHLYHGSGLVVFDLTHPSRHLDFELGLIDRHPAARVMFVCRTTKAGATTDEQTFRDFLIQRVPPGLMARLVFAFHDKRSLSEEIRVQAEASLG